MLVDSPPDPCVQIVLFALAEKFAVGMLIFHAVAVRSNEFEKLKLSLTASCNDVGVNVAFDKLPEVEPALKVS